MKLLYSMGRPEQTLGADIPLDRGSELMMRTIESREGLTARLLSNQAAESKEGQINADPLIQGLIDRLPKPDGPWPLEERAKWLRTAVSIFDLVYNRAHRPAWGH